MLSPFEGNGEVHFCCGWSLGEGGTPLWDEAMIGNSR